MAAISSGVRQPFSPGVGRRHAPSSNRGTARYPSIDEAVATEVEGTPLGERISAEMYDAIRRRARDLLQSYVAEDGSVGIPLAGYLVAARR
jgi:hypothetical protein